MNQLTRIPITCRDPLQKGKRRGDVFIEGVCTWKWKEGGGGDVVLVVVVVVDVYLGWVKKKSWITLRAILCGWGRKERQGCERQGCERQG